MEGETYGMPVKSFVDLKAKIYTYAEDDHEYKKAKGIDENVDVEQKHFECIIFFSGLKICKSFLKFEDKKYIRISWNLKICNFFFEIWKDKKEFSLLKKSEKGASMKFGACFLILHTII